MCAFVNSIDVLGDDIVTDKIIDRTITEYRDNAVIEVSYDAFHNCSSLASINLPNATIISYNAFQACSALTSADFQALTSINQSAFQACSALTTVLLRNAAQSVQLANRNAFTSTPIASGTGYIYVPRALVDTYKAATNWSTYANQFRALEDYTVDGTVTGELDETKI